MNNDIQKAIEVLQSGGLLLYPTDTVWGLGCDATNPEAVDKIFKLKGRSSGKPLIVLIDNDSKLASYVREIPDVAYQLIEYAERPLTIIYDGAKNLAKNLIAEDGSIGIRVTSHPFCKQLLQRFRKPIVSTSANLSGLPAPESFYEISQEIKDGVDYIVNYGQDEVNTCKASTIMKISASGEFRLIRK